MITMNTTSTATVIASLNEHAVYSPSELASVATAPLPDGELTEEEIQEVLQKLGIPFGASPAPQDLFDKLKGVMPRREGYFTANRRITLFGATWAVKLGLHFRIVDRDGQQLFLNADQFYSSLGLGDRKKVSKALKQERLFQMLPAPLKAKVHGPGCLEPLLSLTGASQEQRDRAFNALAAWGGALSKTVANSAMALSAGPIEVNLKESMQQKVNARQKQTTLKTLVMALNRIPEAETHYFAQSVPWIVSMRAEKPAVLPKQGGVTSLPDAEANHRVAVKPDQEPEPPNPPSTFFPPAGTDQDRFRTQRAEIEITPHRVVVVIDNSGRAPDLLMKGFVKNEVFCFEHIKEDNRSLNQSAKTRWLSNLSDATVAGRALRAGLKEQRCASSPDTDDTTA